jgi:hypothetical protein
VPVPLDKETTVTSPATPSDAALPPGPAGATQPPSAASDLGPATVTIASYSDYRSAQAAVDYLSDNGFPVEHTAIVGTGLRLVENVLGRLTVGRATLGGAASGAWFGLFIGLLLGIFANANWAGVVLAGLLIGAAWGAIFGGTAQAMTRGQRDFTSRSSLQAEQYGVVVDVDLADQARQQLVRFNWQASNPS